MSEGNPDDKQDQVEWVPPLADEMADLAMVFMRIVLVALFTIGAVELGGPRYATSIMLGFIAWAVLRGKN